MDGNIKRMKAVKKETIERVIEVDGGELNIVDILIGRNEYKLKVINCTQITGEESLVFDFNDRDYRIIVDKDGIRFERYVCRPNHDHGDCESLQIGVDPVIGVKKGETTWRSRAPYKGEGYEYFKIPFGSKTVEY